MSTMRDHLKQKAAAQSKFEKAEIWNEQEQSELYGIFENVREVNTKIGKTRVVNVREYDTGLLRSIFLTRTVLAKQFDAAFAQPGDSILFQFLGKVKSSKSDREFYNYAVTAATPEEAA